jgi:toluene monooxygenase system ferredoxin subunit
MIKGVELLDVSATSDQGVPVTQSMRVPTALMAEGDVVRVEAEGGPAALVALVEGAPYAVSDACPHRGTSLADGLVRDGVVTCPAHLWQYDLRTGARHDTRGEGLACFPARLEGDDVVVDLPDPAPQPSLREILLAQARKETP